MKLNEIIKNISCELISGSPLIDIKGMSENSRNICPGWIFIARKGLETNGHLFIEDAINRGAAAIILSDRNFVVSGEASVVVMDITPENMALIAENYYGTPKCKLIGITGTNGKTTTCYLIRYFLEKAGVSTGIIGTVAYEFAGRSVQAKRTTPDIFELYELINDMVKSGAKVVVMEVSSHALDQNRIGNLKYDAAIFTNLSRDHLDYHKTMEEYYAAKRKLFNKLKTDETDEKPRAIISLDDQWGRKMYGEMRESEIPVVSYCNADESKAEIHARNIVASMSGNSFELIVNGNKISDVKIPLIGHHNVSNCLAAMTIAYQFGAKINSLVDQAENLPAVPGRLEFIPNDLGILIVVDYAHTDDALNKTLHCLKELKPGNILVVFGCGGDRDKGKRAKMGAVAENYAEFIVVTNDNPRTEDPNTIIEDILTGLSTGKPAVEKDRQKAIEMAINNAVPGDIVLIAGKGHENYQEINRTYHHFDDRETARQIIAELGK